MRQIAIACVCIAFQLVSCGSGDESAPDSTTPPQEPPEAPVPLELELEGLYPEEGATEIARTTVLLLKFSEPLPADFQLSTTFLQDALGDALSGTWSTRGQYAIFHPDVPFSADTLQQFRLAPAIAEGYTLSDAAPTQWTFSVGAQVDSAPPQATPSVVDNATDLLDNFTLSWTFNEPLNPAFLNLDSFQISSSGDAVPGTLSIQADTVSFWPATGRWTPNTHYQASLSDALEDLSGNEVSPLLIRFSIRSGVLAPADSEGMIQLSGGTFMMGADNDSLADGSASANEEPAHPVTLTRPFFISDHEVTVAEYQGCVDEGACDLVDVSSECNIFQGDRTLNPMNCISWNQSQDYLDWKRLKTGRAFRFCTEAEWEFATRAHTTTKWWCGNDDCTTGISWYDSTSRSRTQEVRTKSPNPWGLYDVHGNVWEWTADFYSGSTYKLDESGVSDPTGPESANSRVVRGGGYSSEKKSTRSAKRYYKNPETAHDRSLGLRVCSDD